MAWALSFVSIKREFYHKEANAIANNLKSCNKKTSSFSQYLIAIIIFSILIFSYLFTFTKSPFPCSSFPQISTPNSSKSQPPTATQLHHIIFNIASSKLLYKTRKHYIETWWQPHKMRGFIWLDQPINAPTSSLPAIRISAGTSHLPYTHRRGSRSALRIARIVAEAVRLRLLDVRWYVMCDDDTVFLPDNLLCVLGALDHTQPFYVGSRSESHLQNIIFSYGMAYGGGGIAISRPLAETLARMQDRCIRRYRSLYGSDDRIQACMAELGVPLTHHPGFHQFDVYGDIVGLLAAHPIAPLVSLHHLDVVNAIFPNCSSRVEAVRRLFDGPVRMDSAGVMQQSICYDVKRHWTVSVAWGYCYKTLN